MFESLLVTSGPDQGSGGRKCGKKRVYMGSLLQVNVYLENVYMGQVGGRAYVYIAQAKWD